MGLFIMVAFSILARATDIPAKMIADVPSGRALSIRQPYAEAILQGVKDIEWRTRPTNIRGRIFIYATLRPGKLHLLKRLGKTLEELPRGYIVGSVEIVDCIKRGRYYGYVLENPKRYRTLLKPKNSPQPYWFFPFGRFDHYQN